MKSNNDAWRCPSKLLPWRIALLFGVVLLSSQMPPEALAAPLSIMASPTTLESNADRMISYRHQEHMWQTSDGATHVVINQGTMGLKQGASLALYSSFDSGKTWLAMISLDNTSSYSTADGVLVGDDLNLVYPSSSGKILFSVIHYDNVLKTWSLVRTETAFASAAYTGINPALAIDSQQRIWCAFVSKDRTLLSSNIKLIQRQTAGGWQDTGLIFGATDVTASPERSARPIVLPDGTGIGLVYTVHQYIYWAYRRNDWPVNLQWSQQTLFTSQPPYDIDPYESHFSLVSDNLGNIHVVTTDHGKLLYLRFVGLTQTWDPVKYLSTQAMVAYTQATMAFDKLCIFYNVNTFIKVIESTDSGNTFLYTDLLVHQIPATGSTLNYSNPRIETPGLSAGGQIPVLQQYVDGTKQKMIYFGVPVDAANIAPLANDDPNVTTPQNTGVIINVLANDIDSDGTLDVTSVLVGTAPSFGAAVVNPDGTVTYTPMAGYTGTDSFTYTVKDNSGATSNVATVSVSVI